MEGVGCVGAASAAVGVGVHEICCVGAAAAVVSNVVGEIGRVAAAVERGDPGGITCCVEGALAAVCNGCVCC